MRELGLPPGAQEASGGGVGGGGGGGGVAAGGGGGAALGELRAMAARQQRQIEGQAQLLAAREQRLRFLQRQAQQRVGVGGAAAAAAGTAPAPASAQQLQQQQQQQAAAGAPEQLLPEHGSAQGQRPQPQQPPATTQQQSGGGGGGGGGGAASVAVAGEAERLRRLRERVEAQEQKLRRLRALRGQVDQGRLSNASLTCDLEAIRALFNEKEKELSVAAARVEALTRQLEAVRSGRGPQPPPPASPAHRELDKLRRELTFRKQAAAAQAARVAAQREALRRRQGEMGAVDARIAQLQERLRRKRALNARLRMQTQQQQQQQQQGNAQQQQQQLGRQQAQQMQAHAQQQQLQQQQQQQQQHAQQAALSAPALPLGAGRPRSAGNVAAVGPYLHQPPKAAPAPTHSVSVMQERQEVKGQPPTQQTDFLQASKGLSGPGREESLSEFAGSKADPKYQTLPHNTKFTAGLLQAGSSIISNNNNNNSTTNNANNNNINIINNNNNNNMQMQQNLVNAGVTSLQGMQNASQGLQAQWQTQGPPPLCRVPSGPTQRGQPIGAAAANASANGTAAPPVPLVQGRPVSSVAPQKPFLLSQSTKVLPARPQRSLASSPPHHQPCSARALSPPAPAAPVAAGGQAPGRPALPPKPAVPAKPAPPPRQSQMPPPPPPSSSSSSSTLQQQSPPSPGGGGGGGGGIDLGDRAPPAGSRAPLVEAMDVVEGRVCESAAPPPPASEPPEEEPPPPPPAPSQQLQQPPLPPPPAAASTQQQQQQAPPPPPSSSSTEQQQQQRRPSVAAEGGTGVSASTATARRAEPIRARPLTIRKTPASEQPRLRSAAAATSAAANNNNGTAANNNNSGTNLNAVNAANGNANATNGVSGGVAVPSPLENTGGRPSTLPGEEGSPTASGSPTSLGPPAATTTPPQGGDVETDGDGSAGSPARRGRRGGLKGTRGSALRAGGNARRVSFDPLALLLDAALEGELDLVKRTAAQVSDPSAANDEGITALHNAICAGHLDIVAFLVDFGCDVNAQDSDGWTPLHCAASCNNLQMVRFLVERGACLFAQTLSDQETAAEKCEEDEEGFDGCSEFLYSVQEKLGILNGGVVYAVFDYDAQHADELTFRCGDRLTVLRKGDESEREWWWARKGDQEGYAPRNLLGLYPRVTNSKRPE